MEESNMRNLNQLMRMNGRNPHLQPKNEDGGGEHDLLEPFYEGGGKGHA
jgi:hypothetical protein